MIKKRTKKSKKAVSVMVGYVLLITFGIILSVLVFAYLKSYVPRQKLQCPEDVSIYIKSLDCDAATDLLTLTLKNTGKFNLGGYFIHATSSPAQELATKDLSEYLDPDETEVRIYGGIFTNAPPTNGFTLGTEQITIFDLSDLVTEGESIYSVEIIPTLYKTQGNKQRIVSCGDAKVKENIPNTCP